MNIPLLVITVASLLANAVLLWLLFREKSKSRRHDLSASATDLSLVQIGQEVEHVHDPHIRHDLRNMVHRLVLIRQAIDEGTKLKINGNKIEEVTDDRPAQA